MAATSDESKDDNLWLSLLGQARAAESEHCTAVVLGESGCGAEALIQRLHVEATQGTQEPRVLQDSLSFSHVSIGAGKAAKRGGNQPHADAAKQKPVPLVHAESVPNREPNTSSGTVVPVPILDRSAAVKLAVKILEVWNKDPNWECLR